MKSSKFPPITRKEITDLSVLKDHILCSDEIANMPKDEQEQVYTYCRNHASSRACQETLRQISSAVTKIYFGW